VGSMCTHWVKRARTNYTIENRVALPFWQRTHGFRNRCCASFWSAPCLVQRTARRGNFSSGLRFPAKTLLRLGGCTTDRLAAGDRRQRCAASLPGEESCGNIEKADSASVVFTTLPASLLSRRSLASRSCRTQTGASEFWPKKGSPGFLNLLRGWFC